MRRPTTSANRAPVLQRRNGEVLAQQRPYRFIDRRGTSYSRSDLLFPAASTNTQRTTVNELDRDTHRIVSNTGRRLLMKIGRKLFANFSVVESLIGEQAAFVTQNFQPQFDGEDKAWGDQAEEWLREWHKIMSFEGAPYDYDAFIRLLVIAELRDGDSGFLLTETSNGYPLVQMVPSHRIYSETHQAADEFGRAMIDGVIIDGYRRPMFYRVYNDSKNDYQDIPARSFGLMFTPMWQDQVRGFSALASSAFDLQDIRESREWELIAQKMSATISLLEDNEQGSFDETQGILNTAATFSATSGQEHQPTALTTEKLEGGTIRYFRSNSGSGLKAHTYDRPGLNTRSYQDAVLRDACNALGWSYFFSVDPSKVGGAAMRVIIDRVNRWLNLRRCAVEKVCRRIDGYAISKAVKLGLLPMSEDWWRWKYQRPADLTADRKYDSDVAIQEVNARMTTLQRECARRGEYWEDVQDQWLLEQKRLQEKAKEMGVEIAAAQPAQSLPNRPERKPVNEENDEGESGESGE